MARAEGLGASDRTPGQMFALIGGVLYLLIGIVGWFVTTEFIGFDEDAHLLGFHLNGLHHIIHLALGGIWLFASRDARMARTVNTLFGAVLLLVGLVGMTGVLKELLNIEDVAEPDNYLHLATGALSLYFGLTAAER